ncbi:MAG: PepSY-like domain-containing protein [Prolixibacteraceae bacterium]
MKKSILAFLIIPSFFLISCEDDSDEDSTITLKEIPTEIQSYIDEHFSEQTVSQAILEEDDGVFKFELFLDNFTMLEFSSEKKAIEIDGQSKLPDSVIPESILSYVSTNYKDHYITGWELESGYQQVRLENQTELEFDLDGEFLRIDN